MNTEDFHFFIRVAELKSMSQVAKETNLAVSVVSQKIQRLEKSMSLRLFHRTTRTLTLTQEGQQLLKYGRGYLQGLEILIDDLKSMDQQLIGDLHISASTTFATHVLIPLLSAFMIQHPKIKVHLELDDQNIDLIEQGVDLAIRIGTLSDSSLVAQRLMDNPRLLCASPNYLRRFGIPKTLEDLKNHQCIIQKHQHGLTQIWNLVDENNSLQNIHINGHFFCNSGEAIRQASLSGLGISNHSLWHVKKDLDSGTLVQVLSEYKVQPTAVYAVTSNKKFISHKVQVLIDYLKQNLLKYENFI
ncbi:LysR substrate-binding domain-containing protein [Acinetobacter shaoyimingii]|uniref:LysR family transcriptional regulator n=1 Tax=Acinetobacter shaoyimingii TaxID=2715164 RepID=A0A6G8RVY9_9GAMM|nr:LysR substrate-binding domain-containing protein [Acinetobacter shaoyimingii]NHB57351.1 LysR family transcriptional regulator [Acinetobacter shaoyimingii]QIO06047.1 LysR family transcriptional regulator [Acinetobacter shaoyimingii]